MPFDDKIVSNNRSILPQQIKSIPVQPIISQPIPTQPVISSPPITINYKPEPIKEPLTVIPPISNKELHIVQQQEEVKIPDKTFDPKTTIEEKIVVEKPYIPIPKIEVPKLISPDQVLNFPTQQTLTQIPQVNTQDLTYVQQAYVPQDTKPKVEESNVLPWVIGIGALGLLFYMRTRNSKTTTSEPNYNINNVSI
jgi:hypothetical protein